MKTYADYGIEVPPHISGEYYTTCPQCSNERKKRKAKCLSVNIEKEVWFCHHCSWSGGLSIRPKLNEPHWAKPKYKKPDPLPEIELGNNAKEWFRRRGITEEVLRRNRISEREVYMPQVEEFVKAIAFPYFRGGDLVNVKYRDSKKNFRLEVGAERVLYGLNDIDLQRAVIVEGELDKLSMEVAGIRSCVSVPDGAPSEKAKDYSSKFQFLEADEEKINSVEHWIIAVDNDPPGKRLEHELARRLGREKCKRVIWPEGCKDANDVLTKYGKDALRKCVDNAEPYPINGVFSVVDLSSRIDFLYEHGWEKGVSTGWFLMDGLYTVRPGEFTVVTGIPNSGKSNWVDCLLVNLAKLHGWRFAVFSPENQPVEDHMARMIEKYAKVPFHQGPTMRMDKESLEVCKGWLNQHMFWILPDDDHDWTLDVVLEKAKALVFRHGITGLVIDPWNELEHMCPPGVSETLYISQSLKRIRQFARKHSVHVWVVAHPQKLYKDKDGRYSVPTMYDIAGSAHWRNKADNGITVWREFGESKADEVDVHVQKIRFRQIGRLGVAELIYEPATGTYREKHEYEYGIRRGA